jgi:hypothetical protein
MLSVSFDRTALSLSALTITETPGGSYWLPEQGAEWPRFSRRKEYAPAVRYLGGRTLLARVADVGTLPLTVYARAASGSALDTLKAALQTAVDQWMYDLTLTIDGVAVTYTAECVDDDIAWGEVDSGMVKAHLARGTVAIPLYPGS